MSGHGCFELKLVFFFINFEQYSLRGLSVMGIILLLVKFISFQFSIINKSVFYENNFGEEYKCWNQNVLIVFFGFFLSVL